MRGAADREMFSSLLGVDFAERLHGGALDFADLHEQPARRAPSRLDGLQTRARPAPQQQADPLPQPPALMPPYQPPSPPQVMPAAQSLPMQQQQPVMAIQYLTPDARQRKLAIHKFDGTEVYVGLGSGFFD